MVAAWTLFVDSIDSLPVAITAVPSAKVATVIFRVAGMSHVL